MKSNKIKLLALAISLSILTGCAALQTPTGTFAVQYGTMKTIEQSSNIEADHVLYATDRMRNAIEEDITLSTSSLASTFLERVDISHLQPSDQMLVLAVVRNVQRSIDSRFDVYQGSFTPDQEITLLELLDKIDEAAMMYKVRED